jgi:hypothetical protein
VDSNALIDHKKESRKCWEVTAAWRNGIASDYESGDCRFDPCGGHWEIDGVDPTVFTRCESDSWSGGPRFDSCAG